MATSTQWQLAHEAAARYAQILVPAILGPAAYALVDWSGLPAGASVLDVGCGTGAATRRAAELVGPTGRVIGLDVNAGMLAVAQSLPAVTGAVVEWCEQSADQLPFADATVDVVLCAQTLQFLNNQRPALSEMKRVLKPGGWVAASLWCAIEECPYFHALVEAISTHISRETAAGLAAAFRLSKADEIRTLFAEAGFPHIQMTVKPLELTLPNLTAFVPRHIEATPMAAGFTASSPQAQQAVVQEVSGRLTHYTGNGGVGIPFRTHLVKATN